MAQAQYHNIFALVRELGVPWPFTDWTPSGFWSRQGLVTEAPVFSRRPQLPTMLGQFVHTLPLFRRALFWQLQLLHTEFPSPACARGLSEQRLLICCNCSANRGSLRRDWVHALQCGSSEGVDYAHKTVPPCIQMVNRVPCTHGAEP